MTQALSRMEQIEGRIDRTVAGGIGMSPSRGMVVDSMQQAMEVAKLMSVSGCAVPRHLRNNPGACLAVAIMGYDWGINPFAIANKSYEVNDRLSFEASLFNAVAQRRAPITGRIKYVYAGAGLTRTCTVSAELEDGTGPVDYTSPNFGAISPKNSPLWKNDPDQQLGYFSVRAFVRRHFPDVMMGVYTNDELEDAGVNVPTNGSAPTRGVSAVLAKVSARPALEGQAIVPTPEVPQETKPAPDEQPSGNGHAAQASDATETVNLDTGEVNEPDVSGADTEPANDAQVTTEAEPAKSATLTFEQECEAMGASSGMSPDEFSKALKAAITLGDKTGGAKGQLTRPAKEKIKLQIKDKAGPFAPATAT